MPRAVRFSIYVPTKGLVGDPDGLNTFPNEEDPQFIDVSNTLFLMTKPVAETYAQNHHPDGVVLRVVITTEEA